MAKDTAGEIIVIIVVFGYALTYPFYGWKRIISDRVNYRAADCRYDDVNITAKVLLCKETNRYATACLPSRVQYVTDVGDVETSTLFGTTDSTSPMACIR